MKLSTYLDNVKHLKLSPLKEALRKTGIRAITRRPFLGRSSGGFMRHFCMVLQMTFIVQIDVTSWMRIGDRLPIQMMAEVASVKVSLQIAMTREGLQSVHRRQLFVA